MKTDITVIIVTRNRVQQLKECLESLLNSSFQNYSILIADQSDNEQTIQAVKSFHSTKIKIVSMREKGRAKGLNLLAKKAHSNILAFTDDDCIVSKDWLKQISKTYKKHPYLAGVFGNTYAYKSESHPSEFCPATFEVSQFKLHTFQNLHYYYVGLGNNMSLKKSVLEKIGWFQEWLGTGAIAKSGEESEIIFRILRNGNTLATNPQVILFHNRWLSYKQEKFQQARYTRGFISFLSFYLFTSDRKHAWTFIKVKVHERVLPVFYTCCHLIKELFKESYFFFFEIFAVFEGICTGLIMVANKKISTFITSLH